MEKNWTIGAQLSTSHSSLAALGLDRMLDAVERVCAMIDLDLLVVGSREAPDIFRGFTDARRPVGDVFLWYGVLSDIEGFEESDLVVNWRGARSRGWGGRAEKGSEVDETFRFVCPNNPAARRKTLRRLRQLLDCYPFSGVFLDKIRFPSPANGLEETLSCFCDHCRRAAKAVDLDLDAVVKLFGSANSLDASALASGDVAAASWLDAIAAMNPLVARFLTFRADCVAGLVAEIADEAGRLNRKVSLDLFSPGLAKLVGQDYRRLSRHCVWAKPMTYRMAQGPAGLRLEIPALVEGVTRLFGVDEAQVSEWAARHVKGFDQETLTHTRQSAVPLPLIEAEIEAAVSAMHPVPVYFGLELVNQPGVLDIKPADVRDMVRAGRAANAAGLIVAWDLMHAPIDGVEALAAETKAAPARK